MIQKLLIKTIYFLLKFVKSEISSLSLFEKKCGEIANGEYHCVSIEVSVHSENNRNVKFSSYIHGRGHYSGSTMEESLSKLKEHREEQKKVTKVLNEI